MSKPYDIKRVFTVVRQLDLNTKIWSDFNTRINSLCETAGLPTLPDGWVGIAVYDDLSPAAQKQFEELCNWLTRKLPQHFRL